MSEAAPKNWTEIETAVRPTYTRVMGHLHLEVERRQPGWWEVMIFDGPSENDVQVFADTGPSAVVAARKGELYAWHRQHGGR